MKAKKKKEKEKKSPELIQRKTELTVMNIKKYQMILVKIIQAFSFLKYANYNTKYMHGKNVVCY
jgi:hypothetical protein